MSEMVHYTGKLQLIEKYPNETLDELCKRILSENNYSELNEYCDSWVEMLCDELYGKYIIANENVYKVIEKNYNDIDSDIFNAHDNNDGTIDYEVLYYNGGCSFDEAIEYAIDNMKSKIHK